MTTTGATPFPLEILPGVQPVTETTELSSQYWTYSDKIRWVNGKPEKIGGWLKIAFDNSNTIAGMVRTIYSADFSNRVQTIIGSNEKLYNLTGSELTNITPLNPATTTIANSLDTHYATLGNNPLASTNGSKNVVVTDSEAALFREGDTYALSGAATFNGIPDTDINKGHIVRAVGVGTITIRVATTATGAGSGGGNAVVRTSGLITVDATAHEQLDGDRTKLAGATNTGGIVAATHINVEHIIRNATANTFDVMTGGAASSAVSNGGGSGTTYQVEIDDGNADENYGQGYGAGLYGVGLYGTALSSASNRVLPRIWYMSRFGVRIIGTPGNQTGLYEWDGDADAAPVLVANAPTAINYAFVSNEIVVTFGDSGVGNRIKTSDQGNRTIWVGTSENQVFEDDIEGAGRFISHVAVKDLNLIFTEQETWTMRYIGLPLIWEIDRLDSSIGLIASMARIAVNGVAFWMGQDNFYMWRGGNVEVIPARDQKQATILKYVFDNLNRSQKSKIYVEYIEKFNELRFHYPSAGSNNPDRVACVDLNYFDWWIDTIDRTAAEYPNALLTNHRMADSQGNLYQHEYGNDDDVSALGFVLRAPKMKKDRNVQVITGVVPDSVQSGNISLNVSSWQYPQSAGKAYDQNFIVMPTTEQIPVQLSGKYWQVEFSGEALGQRFIMGQWEVMVQKGGPQ